MCAVRISGSTAHRAQRSWLTHQRWAHWSARSPRTTCGFHDNSVPCALSEAGSKLKGEWVLATQLPIREAGMTEDRLHNLLAQSLRPCAGDLGSPRCVPGRPGRTRRPGRLAGPHGSAARHRRHHRRPAAAEPPVGVGAGSPRLRARGAGSALAALAATRRDHPRPRRRRQSARCAGLRHPQGPAHHPSPERFRDNFDRNSAYTVAANLA